MDLTDRLIEHDMWLTRRLLDKSRTLTDAQLDTPLTRPAKPLPFEDEQRPCAICSIVSFSQRKPGWLPFTDDRCPIILL